METWKEISGYEKRYLISNCGNVKSLDRVEFMPWVGKERHVSGKPLRLQKKDNDYLFVVLSDGGGRNTQTPSRAFVRCFK